MRFSIPGVLLALWCFVIFFGAHIVEPRAGIIDLTAINELPSSAHFLGTDALGRDMLVTLLVGGQTSFIIGIMAAVIALVSGTTIGMLGAYYGGWFDTCLMRILDTMRAVPTLLLLLFWQAMTEPSFIGVAVILGAVGWLYTARIVRSETHIHATREHVLAARMMGIGSFTIIRRHILPYCAGRIRILFLLELSGAMAMEAAISFLGMGLPPYMPSPGTMLAHAMNGVLLGHWWQAMLPGMMLVITLVLVHACIVSMKKEAL